MRLRTACNNNGLLFFFPLLSHGQAVHQHPVWSQTQLGGLTEVATNQLCLKTMCKASHSWQTVALSVRLTARQTNVLHIGVLCVGEWQVTACLHACLSVHC